MVSLTGITTGAPRYGRNALGLLGPRVEERDAVVDKWSLAKGLSFARKTSSARSVRRESELPVPCEIKRPPRINTKYERKAGSL